MFTRSVAAVSWHEAHPCHVWFGRPTQVWSNSTVGYCFIPVRNIKSRVIYCKTTINFGRIGVDSPLDI